MDGRERHGPYDRPLTQDPGAKVTDDDLCPFCRWPAEKWWPQIWAPLVGQPGLHCCHVKCAEASLNTGDTKTPTTSTSTLEATFGQSLKDLLQRSESALYARNPSGRLSIEEERVSQLVREGRIPSWPFEAMAPVPVALFHLQGVLELRLTGSCNLVELPPEIGLCRHLETMSLIGNSLSAIPAEVGMLKELGYLYLNGNFLRTIPAEVCALPKLQEICLDANCIEEAPCFSSTCLRLYTAPGNKFPDIPLAPHFDRLEVHGNQIRNIIPMNWGPVSNLVTLKVMGNQLTELPNEVALMPFLRILSVANNRLRMLPEKLSQLQELEWLLAYENCITELPKNLAPGCRTLTRLLLESNPLTPTAVASLISDLSRSRIKTLGLDTRQVSEAVEALPNWEPLPSAVSVGTVLPISGGQISLKLTRASQLRRDGIRAVAEPAGPPDPASHPAALLIVAFGASQGEPEWLGFLRRLLELGQVKACGQGAGSLDELLKDALTAEFDLRMSRLWSNCPMDASYPPKVDTTPSMPLEDFDVLTVVDHRMRWYNEDRPALAKALRDLRPKYSKMLFVGASMGGFGALLHGGSLADAVVAFNPQATLTEALLRPPAETPKDLEDLSQAVIDSVKMALERKAQITVHCAADEHLSHALALPSGIRLVVHPLQPRKPFARILDRAQLLIPIVSDALFRLLHRDSDFLESQTVLGCWCRNGALKYVTADASQIFRLFFGPGSASIPRPGDWFCGSCRARNCKDRYFCWRCKPPSPVTHPATVKVLDSSNYPTEWDWGCLNCGAAMCGYQYRCSNCGADRPG